MKNIKFPILSLIFSIALASEIIQKNISRDNFKSSKLYKLLYNNSSDAKFSSEEETDNEDIENFGKKKYNIFPEELNFPSIKASYPEVLNYERLMWKTNGIQNSPFLPHYKKSHLQPGHEHLFDTPMDSFLAFIPIEFGNVYAFNSNEYYSQKQKS